MGTQERHKKHHSKRFFTNLITNTIKMNTNSAMAEHEMGQRWTINDFTILKQNKLNFTL